MTAITSSSSVEKDAKTGRFLPGNSGFSGRPRGSRNKLGESFVSDLQADWRENGSAVIIAVRAADPVAYLRVVAGLLPAQLEIEVKGSTLEGCETMDDVVELLLDEAGDPHELIAFAERVRDAAVARLAEGATLIEAAPNLRQRD